VRGAIRAYGWKPIGHAGYARLRRRIMDGQVLDTELR
jgi:hypothetical protein